MRRMRAFGTAALVALVGLTACTVDEPASEPTGEESGAGGETTEITFLTFETPNLTPEVWEEAIQRAVDQHPDIRVERLVSPTQDRTAYAQDLLNSGQFPDVLIAVSPAGFAEGGHLYAWEPEELEDFLCPTCGAVGGEVYQLPANTQTIPVVYYNTDLFSEAGITEPPTTYDELLEVAATLRDAGITPFVVGQGHDSLGPTWAGILATEVYAENPEWMHDRRAGEVSFSDPGFVRAAEKLAELAELGYINPGDVSRDYAATQQAFLDGEGAMYAMGNWFAAAADNPDSQPDFEIGQFFWPSDDGELIVSAYTGGGLLVNANSENMDAAKRFALAFQLDKENLDASTRNDGLFPAIKDYAPPSDVGPVFQEGYDMWQEALEQDAIVPPFGFEAGDDAMLPGVVPDWDTVAQDLVIGQKTPEEAAAFLDSEWEKEES